MKASKQEYRVGIMKMPVEKREPRFGKLVDEATEIFDSTLTQEVGIKVEVVEFLGPHLSPTAGAYSPLDFLYIGLSENVVRRFHFLLMVTEVDLSATGQPYVLALPSQLTNIGIISTKRLAPSFWGYSESDEQTARRLAALMLHSLGHLLGLPHCDEGDNVMNDIQSVEDLDEMEKLSAEQQRMIRHNLPFEAREEVATEHLWIFAARQVARNWRSIWQAVRRANPLRLAASLPTMVTTALSVAIVLFFSAEIWDVASTVELVQLILFALVSLFASTIVLYRAFAFGAIRSRTKRLTESTVVTEAATSLSLFLTMVVLYIAFFGLAYLGIVTVFPTKLMSTWPTVDPAVRPLDHIKLGLFLAAMGMLAGSLGGRAESQALIRNVLFVDEQT